MKFVTLNDISIHFEDIGPADGLPIVFSNSLGTDFRIWDGVINAFKASSMPPMRFIRYDKRGHGLSDAPMAPYTIDEHVADLDALLDHLEVKDAVVIGLSVGGLITQALSALSPDKMRAIVLMDTSHKIGDKGLWTSRINTVREKGLEAIASSILERWFSDDFRRTRKTEFSAYSNMLIRTPLEGYLGTCSAIRDADLEEIARNIKLPTLLLVGSNDGATPPQLVGSTHKLIPGSQFEIIDGPGHLPNLEMPEETAKLIEDFLKENAIA